MILKILQVSSISLILFGTWLIYRVSEVKGFNNFDPAFEDGDTLFKKGLRNRRIGRWGYRVIVLGVTVQLIEIFLDK
jgi:hypothetical protein